MKTDIFKILSPILYAILLQFLLLAPSLVIVREIAALAQTETVARPFFVLTMGSGLASSFGVVAIEAHILGVVGLVCVLAISDLFVQDSFWHACELS